VTVFFAETATMVRVGIVRRSRLDRAGVLWSDRGSCRAVRRGVFGGSAMRRIWVPLVLAVLAALLSPVSVSAQERDRGTARDLLLGEPGETVGAPDNSDFTLPGGGVAG
jgi:hypothetical protein